MLLLGIWVAGCSNENANQLLQADVEGNRIELNERLESENISERYQAELFDCHKLEINFFWAPWLPASEEYFPHLDEMARRFHNVARIRKISIDNNADWAGKWNIMSVPSVIFIKNGQLINRCSGFDDPADLRKLVEATIETI